MTDPDDQCTIEASFALLELCLEQLSSIAPVEHVSGLLDLLPEISAQAQRLILVELIKYDLASASESGIARSLEFYWPECGEILPQELIPFDLVLEEVQLRRAAGEKPKWADYRQRFPDLADTIGKWLAGGDTQGFSGATSKVPELPVGQLVDDFQVLKQLGQGAFARVYLARQQSMQRLVALKATSRGSEEPQALSQLDHANVVRVYDQREIADPPTILLYMQYLAGGTLADCIKQVRDLPPATWSGKHILDSINKNLLEASQTVPEQSVIREQIAQLEWAEVVAWIGIQLAEGLGYADGKGVLHRDVKPANILLSAEAIPKLADFNVSCSGLSGRAGAAAYFGGSLAYMSPEQLQVADPRDDKQADQLDGRSDLYALGIVLWELWQGRRPWTLGDLASSWTEAVQLQRDVRKVDFETIHPSKTAAERVLEKVLRSLLEVDPDSRPKSGKEAAARLKLAFYPELANRFEPAPRSLSGWLLRIPVLLISAIIIFGPNTAASRFNYEYNDHRFKNEYGHEADATDDSDGEAGTNDTHASHNSVNLESAEELERDLFGAEPRVAAMAGESDDLNEAASEEGLTMREETAAPEPAQDSLIYRYFVVLAMWVNGVVFPLGALLFLIIVLPLAHIVHRAKQGQIAISSEVTQLWNIGNRASQICGVLWAVSGVIFAYSMMTNFAEFGVVDAFHFFISLVLCGGVAWIYPYFGMTLLSLLVYYPKVIAPAMEDPEFEQRCARIRRHSFWYLLSAAAIPLTAVGLLVFRDRLDKALILLGVCITGLGLVVAFFAYQKLEETMQQYAKVLGEKDKKRITI